MIVNIDVTQRIVTRPASSYIVQSNVCADSIRVTFDGEWAGLDRYRCVFVNGSESVEVAFSYLGMPVEIPIPWEACRNAGRLFITFIGYGAGELRIVTRQMDDPLTVLESGRVSGDNATEPPTPDELEQIMNAVSAGERDRNLAQARNNADQAANNAAALDGRQYILVEGEYGEDGVPTIDGNGGTSYFVPYQDVQPGDVNRYAEWRWVNGAWELVGDRNMAMAPITTAQVDAIVDTDATLEGTETLQLPGLSYFWAKLKAAFARVTHTHSASDITSGQIQAAQIANGAVGSDQLSQTVRDSISRIKHGVVSSISVPANSSVDVPIEFSSPMPDSSYSIAATAVNTQYAMVSIKPNTTTVNGLTLLVRNMNTGTALSNVSIRWIAI